MKINHIIVSTEKVIENKRPMSRAAKGNEKYGKNGMKALAKAGREGASQQELGALKDKYSKAEKKTEAQEIRELGDRLMRLAGL